MKHRLLGITIDTKLAFKNHTNNLCRTAQYKWHAFRRIKKCLTLDKAVLLGKTFVNNQFNYAPLIRMFCRKTLYYKIKKNNYSTLKGSNLPKSLESSSVSVHERHPGFLVTEIYKSTTQINPEFMWPYCACV